MSAERFNEIQGIIGMSSAELAFQFHVHPRTVQKWKYGERPINGLVEEKMLAMLAEHQAKVAKSKRKSVK